MSSVPRYCRGRGQTSSSCKGGIFCFVGVLHSSSSIRLSNLHNHKGKEITPPRRWSVLDVKGQNFRLSSGKATHAKFPIIFQKMGVRKFIYLLFIYLLFCFISICHFLRRFLAYFHEKKQKKQPKKGLGGQAGKGGQLILSPNWQKRPETNFRRWGCANAPPECLCACVVCDNHIYTDNRWTGSPHIQLSVSDAIKMREAYARHTTPRGPILIMIRTRLGKGRRNIL